MKSCCSLRRVFLTFALPDLKSLPGVRCRRAAGTAKPWVLQSDSVPGSLEDEYLQRVLLDLTVDVLHFAYVNGARRHVGHTQ